MRNNQVLNVLDLTGNQICFQAMIFMRDYLNKYNILKSLILAGNKLRDRGIKVLADGLGNNTGLVHLDVTNNDIGDEGFTYKNMALLLVIFLDQIHNLILFRYLLHLNLYLKI